MLRSISSHSDLDYRFTIKHDEDDTADDVIDDEDVFLFFSHISKTTSWVDPRTQSKESTSATERSHHHFYFSFSMWSIKALL